MKEAMFWTAEGEAVRCGLCRHQCLIQPGHRGLCNVRENRGGVLYSLVYGKPISEAVDPIEKKPLYHLLPGSTSFSIATRGCNFRCLHCQNCEISQVSADETFRFEREVPPERVVESALATGCRSISYTYTEPTIYFEYAYETAQMASAKGLKNIFVTNGYITSEALRTIAPCLDAANIDLKFSRDSLYRQVCGARLEPVLESIMLYHELGIWIEITTLIIAGYNDSEKDLRTIAEFIAGVSPDIPWHVTAFYPRHKMSGVPPTPISILRRAREMGIEAGLQYVYTGNLPDEAGSVTRCPGCGTSVVERRGFGIRSSSLDSGMCPQCGDRIAGVWR